MFNSGSLCITLFIAFCTDSYKLEVSQINSIHFCTLIIREKWNNIPPILKVIPIDLSMNCGTKKNQIYVIRLANKFCLKQDACYYLTGSREVYNELLLNKQGISTWDSSEARITTCCKISCGWSMCFFILELFSLKFSSIYKVELMVLHIFCSQSERVGKQRLKIRISVFCNSSELLKEFTLSPDILSTWVILK